MCLVNTAVAEKDRDKKVYIYLHAYDNIFHNLWYMRHHFVFSLPRIPYKVVVIHSKLPNEEEGPTEAISAPCVDQLLRN